MRAAVAFAGLVWMGSLSCCKTAGASAPSPVQDQATATAEWQTAIVPAKLTCASELIRGTLEPGEEVEIIRDEFVTGDQLVVETTARPADALTIVMYGPIDADGFNSSTTFEFPALSVGAPPEAPGLDHEIRQSGEYSVSLENSEERVSYQACTDVAR